MLLPALAACGAPVNVAESREHPLSTHAQQQQPQQPQPPPTTNKKPQQKGTGKTLLARAVANRTDACFIRVIGSELVQKYVGEGARMVRELFQMARSKKACLIFFDEVDAIGGARFDDGAGGDNEVQRTMLEIVNQLDGFDSRGNVKVCARGGVWGWVCVCVFGGWVRACRVLQVERSCRAVFLIIITPSPPATTHPTTQNKTPPNHRC